MDKRHIEYRGYHINFNAGWYYIDGFKTPYAKLETARETIDFLVDEEDFND